MAAILGPSDDRRIFLRRRRRRAEQSRLRMIVYRGALETGGDAAANCVALFDRNGWTRRLDEAGEDERAHLVGFLETARPLFHLSTS